ncbi:hypothetical protein Taro_001479 [Colocasia esculenta]|uniref:Myb/SANT-like DNA-binding domain-containing protein n=1 Tax=Colocasia esculenta TaxID=4460 RepID=A0A843TI29_COLES|nr:hypothetical protein [Colocasia esculenta]
MDHRSRQQQQPPHTGGGGGNGGGREDCWSDGATEALVEAWGERYVQLSRGNLRQKDWKDVADAVNEHLDAVGKPPKSDIQCKNRIDTLKKKYKIEKARPGPSDWAFYSRLDGLVGPSSASKPTPSAGGGGKKLQVSGASAIKSQRHPSLTFIVKHRPLAKPSPNLKPSAGVHSGASSSRSRANSSPVSSESSRGDSGGGEKSHDDEEKENAIRGEENDMLGRGRVSLGRRRQWGSLADGGGIGGGNGGDGMEGAFGELATAIVKFGEIYERVESSKQQQMLELERQKMEFAKELEFQRMQMFMEAQLELEKMKRPKYASSGAGEASNFSGHLFLF